MFALQGTEPSRFASSASASGASLAPLHAGEAALLGKWIIRVWSFLFLYKKYFGFLEFYTFGIVQALTGSYQKSNLLGFWCI